MAKFDVGAVRDLQEALDAHPVYAALRTVADLRVFMSHHVYSVWDFMSLIKYLQGRVAPVRVPWTPRGSAAVRYFINQLVMEEESDEAPPGEDGIPRHASHFEFYCQAMAEIGADADAPRAFVRRVEEQGVRAALASGRVPEPSRRFTGGTFDLLDADRPHCVAAALALGREHVIPGMFRSFLGRMGIPAGEAPAFHYYLERHVHLDEDFHGPLSLRLLDELCEGDPGRVAEAEGAARDALGARITFWDGVAEAVAAARTA